MKKRPRLKHIPSELAERLCRQIRQEANQNWHTASARWCWRCRKSYEARNRDFGYDASDGNRGCVLVNVRYAEVVNSANFSSS